METKKTKKTNKNLLAILLVVVAFLIMFLAFNYNNFFRLGYNKTNNSSVIVTLFPFYDMVNQLLPEEIEVEMLVEDKDMHSYELKSSDVDRLREAAAFVYSSEAFEFWADDIISNLPFETSVINISKGLGLDLSHDDHGHEEHGDKEDGHEEHGHKEHGHEEHGHKEEGEEGHDDHGHDEHGKEEHGHKEEGHDDHGHDEHGKEEHGHKEEGEEGHDDHGDDEHAHEGGDPHFWLDFALDQAGIDYLRKFFIQKFPEQEEAIEENAANLIQQFKDLDEEYRNGLANCRQRELYLVGHNSFGYLVDRYNLEYRPFVEGYSTLSAPSLKSTLNLVDEIKEKNIKYVFYGMYENPKQKNNLEEELGLTLLPLNNGQLVTKEDRETGFINLMKFNLENLKKGLECEN